MATKFYFDFRDIFRAGRLGLSGKKMMMHFLGLMLGYVIYEALTYLSLVATGRIVEFWNSYGLRPVFFVAGRLNEALPLSTIIMMAIGAFIWLIIYYLFTTAVAKVAVEQLRGDDFYSMRDALKFAGKNWKSIYLTTVALIGILIFCLFWPSLVGLIDLIPKVELASMHAGSWITTFLTIPVYFMGLFMVLLVIVCLLGLVLIPPVVAVTGEDIFETIYQLFSTVWNQPWRLVIYDLLLGFVTVLGSVVFAALSIAGMCIAFLPSALLANQGGTHYFANVIARSLRVIGADSLIQYMDKVISGVQASASMVWTLDIATFFLFSSFIVIAAVIVAYPLSMISSGYTILYVVLRKKSTDEDMLAVEEEEEIISSMPEKPEEKSDEESAEESDENQ